MTGKRQVQVMLQVILVRAEFMGKRNLSVCTAVNGSAMIVDD